MDLFDYLVGATEYVERHGQPERHGGFEIDGQLDFGHLLDRQSGRFLAFENTADIDAGLRVRLRKTAAVAHQPAGRREIPNLVHRWHPMAQRQPGQLSGASVEEYVARDHEPAGSPLYQCGEGLVELGFRAGVQHMSLQGEHPCRRLQLFRGGLSAFRVCRVDKKAEALLPLISSQTWTTWSSLAECRWLDRRPTIAPDAGFSNVFHAPDRIFLTHLPAQLITGIVQGAKNGRGQMVHIECKERVRSSWRRAAGCLTTVALLYGLLTGIGPSGAWSQQAPMQLNSLTQLQKERKRSTNFAIQRLPVESPVPSLTPIAIPVPDPTSALGSALLSCNKGAEGYESGALPGARGEVKLDQCYRGRDHLVCSFNALLSEARSLLENYLEIVNANYPAIGNVEEVCRRIPEGLARDVERASDFATRFRTLKAEYDARINCVNRIEGSLKDVTLSDMVQAPSILSSMIDSIEGDIKGVSAAQAQLVELSEKMSASHKAILTIRRIHRAMCVSRQLPRADAEDRGPPSLLERTGPFVNR